MKGDMSDKPTLNEALEDAHRDCPCAISEKLHWNAENGGIGGCCCGAATDATGEWNRHCKCCGPVEGSENDKVVGCLWSGHDAPSRVVLAAAEALREEAEFLETPMRPGHVPLTQVACVQLRGMASRFEKVVEEHK